MATQDLSLTTVSKNATDLSSGGLYQTMTSGAGNGSKFPFSHSLFIVIRDDTANPATATIKAAQPSPQSARSMTVPDKDISIAAGEIKVIPVSSAFNSNGFVTVEADEALKIMAIRQPVLD